MPGTTAQCQNQRPWWEQSGLMLESMMGSRPEPSVCLWMDDRDPRAETVRSVFCMADFGDKRYPLPDRGITTKGFPAFENDNETFGLGRQRPMGTSPYYSFAVELFNRPCPGGCSRIEPIAVPICRLETNRSGGSPGGKEKPLECRKKPSRPRKPISRPDCRTRPPKN